MLEELSRPAASINVLQPNDTPADQTPGCPEVDGPDLSSPLLSDYGGADLRVANWTCSTFAP